MAQGGEMKDLEQEVKQHRQMAEKTFGELKKAKEKIQELENKLSQGPKPSPDCRSVGEGSKELIEVKQKLKQEQFATEGLRRNEEECRKGLADWMGQHVEEADFANISQMELKALLEEFKRLFLKKHKAVGVLQKRITTNGSELDAVSRLLDEAEAELKKLSEKLVDSHRSRDQKESEHQWTVQNLNQRIRDLMWQLENGDPRIGMLQQDVLRKDAELEKLRNKEPEPGQLEEKQREIEQLKKNLNQKEKELKEKASELNDKEREIKRLTRNRNPDSPSSANPGTPTSVALVLRPRFETGVTADSSPVAISLPSSDEPPASADLVSVANDAFGNVTIAVLFGDGRLGLYSLTDGEIRQKGTITLRGQFKSIHLGENEEDCYALRKDGGLELYSVTGDGSPTSQTSPEITVVSVTFNPQPGEDTVVVAFRSKNRTNAAPKLGVLNLLNEETPNTILVEGLQCDALRIGFNQSGTRFAAFDTRRIVIYSVENRSSSEYKLLRSMQAAIGDPLNVGILDTKPDMVGVVTKQLRGFAIRSAPCDGGRVESRVIKMEGLELGLDLYAFSTPCSVENDCAAVWAIVAKENKIHVRRADRPNSDSHLLSYHEAPISVLTVDRSSTFIVSGDKEGRVALWHI